LIVFCFILQTTIVAAQFDGGVILGADSRTSCGTFIANRVTDKIAKITDNIYCLRSGAAADTQALSELVAFYLEYQKANNGRPPTVKETAHEFSHICYHKSDKLMASVIVAGYDHDEGADIYSVSVDGMLLREKVAVGGSGSQYVRGLIKEHWVPNMKKEMCAELVKRSEF